MSFPSDYPSDQGPQQQSMSLGGFQQPEEQEPLVSQDIDYELDWSEEKRLRLGRRLTSQISRYLTSTSIRRMNCRKWRADWDVMPEETASDTDDGPHRNASQITTADSRRASNAHHSRLNQQILLLDPPFAVIARDDEAVAAVPQIEDALPAMLEEAEWQVHGDDVHQELPKVGNCFLRLTYDQDVRPRPYYAGDLDEDMAKARVMAGSDPITASFDSLRKDAEGRVMRKLAFKQQVVRHGLVFKCIPWEDGIILPATARDASEAWAIGERVLVTGEELWTGAKRGKYLQEEVDALLRLPPDGMDEDFLAALDLQGINPQMGGEDIESISEDGHLEACLYHTYLCWEMCVKLDGNDDGYQEWCWVVIHPGTQKILRLQYLPWEHGEPHYHHFRYLKRTGRLWAQGVVELIATFQDGRSNAFNQLLDWADLAIRIGTLLLTSEDGLEDPDEFELTLGQVIKCHNINGVKQLELPPLAPEHRLIPDMLKQEIDLLTGASDPAMGKEAAGQHTLGEIQIAMSNGNLHFENIAAFVARQWARVWDQARFLIAQYGEGEDIPYRKSALPGAKIQIDEVTGQVMPPDPMAQPATPFGMITSDMLRRRVDLVPAGLAHMSDIQSRIQQAQITYNTVMALPVVQSSPKLVLMALDYYLQQLRVPIRKQFLQALEEAYMMLAGQAQMAAQQQQQQEAGTLGAQAAGAEGHLMGALAAQHGIGPNQMGGMGGTAMG